MTDSMSHMLSRIDRVVEDWERRPDAMRWSPNVPTQTEQIERVRAAMRPLAEALTVFAVRSQQASEAMRPLAAMIRSFQKTERAGRGNHE